MDVIEVLKVRKYQAGYETRLEIVESHCEDQPTMEMRNAYNPSGEYIGQKRMAHFLCSKRGIAPIKNKATHSVCSIGFNEEEQKWYGWSHRAICGFGIGDRIFEEHYGDDNTLYTQHGEKTIETLEDAKLAASNFASSVS